VNNTTPHTHPDEELSSALAAWENEGGALGPPGYDSSQEARGAEKDPTPGGLHGLPGTPTHHPSRND
jgi:hypothetical protein